MIGRCGPAVTRSQGGIEYIAGICFPPLSGLDDTADKYSPSKVEKPQQQNKCVLFSIILIVSSHLVGVEWRNRALLLSESDCVVFAQYGFSTLDLWLCTTVESLHPVLFMIFLVPLCALFFIIILKQIYISMFYSKLIENNVQCSSVVLLHHNAFRIDYYCYISVFGRIG